MILVHKDCTVIGINSRDTAQQNRNKKSLDMQKCSQASSMQMKWRNAKRGKVFFLFFFKLINVFDLS